MKTPKEIAQELRATPTLRMDALGDLVEFAANKHKRGDSTDFESILMQTAVECEGARETLRRHLCAVEREARESLEDLEKAGVNAIAQRFIIDNGRRAEDLARRMASKREQLNTLLDAWVSVDGIGECDRLRGALERIASAPESAHAGNLRGVAREALEKPHA